MQSRLRQMVRQLEISSRRIGLWESMAPELYADYEAQKTWSGQRDLQLPIPVQMQLNRVPLYTFSWDSEHLDADLQVL